MATELRERMVRHMRIAGLAQKTIKTYVCHIASLARHYNQSPEALTKEEIYKYLEYCIVDLKHADATISNACAAFRYLYRRILEREDAKFNMPSRKMPKKLPNAMTHEQVQTLLEMTSFLKHRTIFATAYGAGLRMKELCNLRIRHIDRSSMQIRVEQGKGKKDRYTVLQQWLLPKLEIYARAFKPEDYLFYGKHKSKPISPDIIGKTFKKVCARSGIQGFRGIHTLRHTFATHMLIAGTDIYAVSRMLGHTCIKTTERYLHMLPVSTRDMPDPMSTKM